MSRLFPLRDYGPTMCAHLRGGPMKSTHAALAAAALFFAASGWAQHGDHKMVSPGDLKWNDVPSLPPGAKIAVIEGPMNEPVPFTVRLKLPAKGTGSFIGPSITAILGPMNEPVPFTVRLKLPANYQIPAHW